MAFSPLTTFASEHKPARPGNWYKGIVHAHANWGVPQLPTTSPDVIVRWYREHNYNFVSITDLNYYTPTEGLKALGLPKIRPEDVQKMDSIAHFKQLQAIGQHVARDVSAAHFEGFLEDSVAR